MDIYTFYSDMLVSAEYLLNHSFKKKIIFNQLHPVIISLSSVDKILGNFLILVKENQNYSGNRL